MTEYNTLEDFNPFEGFDPWTGEPPEYARSFFQNVVDTARRLIDGMTTEEVIQQSREFLLISVKHMKALELSLEDLESFEKTELPTVHDMFGDLPNIKPRVASFMEFMKVGEESAFPLSGMMGQSSDKEAYRSFGVMMLVLVSAAKQDEKSFYQGNAAVGTKSLDEILNPHIATLQNIHAIVEQMPLAFQLIERKEQHIDRAKSGGKGRSERFEELREIVEEKAELLYSHEPAAKAARKLAETLSEDWLHDREGNPLLVDPVL